MNQYDLTFLLNEETELKTLKELVASLGGKLNKEEKWGKGLLHTKLKDSIRLIITNGTLKCLRRTQWSFENDFNLMKN